MNDEVYIEIPKWEEFQHYKKRHPPWIKNYTRLLLNDSYLALTAPQRAVLHGLWMLYAAGDRKVPHNTSKLSRKLGVRVTKRTLDSLRDAGFIEIVASSVLDQRQSERKILASKDFSHVTNARQAMYVLNGGNEEVA